MEGMRRFRFRGKPNFIWERIQPPRGIINDIVRVPTSGDLAEDLKKAKSVLEQELHKRRRATEWKSVNFRINLDRCRIYEILADDNEVEVTPEAPRLMLANE